MLPSLVIAFAAIASSAFAQNDTNFQTCCEIDPGSESTDDLHKWCLAQTNTCPLLCEHGQTANNTCDVTNLTYNCTCLTGTTPNISAYGQTLPSLECDAWVGQCIKAHPNDANGQAFCHSFVCGKLNASALGPGASTSSGSSAMSTGGPTASSSVSSTAGSATAATTSKAAASGPTYYGGREIGTCVIIMALAVLFGFAL